VGQAAQLVGEGSERLREAEALLAVSTTVNSTLEVPEALRLICRELARLLGADAAAAYRHEGTADQLIPVAGYHVPKELMQTLLGTPLPLREQGFYAPIWQERRPVLSDDVAADPRFSHDLFRRFPHQSGLVLPLVLDEAVAGAFYLVWWTARRRLTEREQELIASITAQVTVLLKNARRFEKAERERLHLGVMYDLARRMAAIQDADQLLSLLVEEAAGLLGAEAAGIRLLEGDALVISARNAAAAGVMKRPRIKVGESLTGRIVSMGAPLAVEDLVEDRRLDPDHMQGAVELGFHGFLGVPLMLHGRAIGALNVFTKQRRVFTPSDVSLLSAFADQASVAITKQRLLREAEDARAAVERLYAESRAREREATKLYEITSQLASSLDVDRILDQIVGKTVDLLRETKAGWAMGRVTIEGTGAFTGRRLDVQFQNEHLVAREGDRVRAIVPDLISMLDSATAEPITTEAIKYGQRMKVLGISAAPIMRSQAALAVFGPQAFGLEDPFVPVETLNP